MYLLCVICFCFFFFQAEDGIRDTSVTGVQTCALPISSSVISRTMGYCEDAKERGLESCAVGASIGAISCLPSLAAAGWGYFICAGAVAAGAAACEISVNSEYDECVDNQSDNQSN